MTDLLRPRIFNLLSPLLLGAALAGCVETTAGDRAEIVSTPDGILYIEDIGTYPGLPRAIGTHERGDVTAYGARVRDFSVTYVVQDSELRMVSTVYFTALDVYPDGPLQTLEGHFEDAVSGVAYYHPDDFEVEQSGTITVRGRSRDEGLWALFRYSDSFGGREQELRSELALFFVDGHAVKFRHTYPRAQSALRMGQTYDLWERIDWSDPARITEDFLELFKNGDDPGIPGLAAIRDHRIKLPPG